MRERLAESAHEIWAHWMRYMFTQGTYNDDGSWTMPADKAERWKRQSVTLYDGLTEGEKASDRKVADSYLSAAMSAFEEAQT